MPYPPPIPLPVPAAINSVPPEIVNLELDSVGLMSPEEQQSNQQLYHSVRTPLSCSPLSHRATSSPQALLGQQITVACGEACCESCTCRMQFTDHVCECFAFACTVWLQLSPCMVGPGIEADGVGLWRSGHLAAREHTRGWRCL